MLSVQPGALQRRASGSSRPSSAKGGRVGSAFAPAASLDGRLAGGATTTSTSAKVESDLISNLKEQISCLEMEVGYLKERNTQLNEGNPAASVPIYTVAGGENGDFRATHADLLAHAGRLEKEVADLRARFAEREKQHHLDLAHVRAGAEVGGRDTHSGQTLTVNFKQELQQVRETHAKDVAQMQEAQAQQVITLQKTVERVNIEHQTLHNELLATLKERDVLLADMAGHKDQLRTMRETLDTTNRQYAETQRMLRAEQDERRRLETKEKELTFQVGQGHQELVAGLGQKIADLEERAKKASAEGMVRQYASDQLTVTHNKLQADMLVMVQEKGTTQEQMHQMQTQITTLNAAVAKERASVADVSSERDYFRLQIDRLKVDHSVLDVKTNQLEAKVEGDKTAYLNLERQYCTALETVDQLKRESKSKERVYEQLDGNDMKLRQANLVLTQELQTLRHSTDDLKNALIEISTKYEANRDLADQARTEQHLAMTLTKLDKMKGELQNLLGTQLRLTQDLSTSMMDLPDSSVVLRAMSPSRVHQSIVEMNQSAVATVNQSAAAVAATTQAAVLAATAPAASQEGGGVDGGSQKKTFVSAADINADISAILAGPPLTATIPSPSSSVVTQTPTNAI